MNTSKKTIYEFGDFSFDMMRRRVERIDGKTLSLPPKAFDVLQILIENAGEIVGKEELMRRIWSDTFVEDSNLTQTIYLLRKALGEDAAGQLYIQTIPKRGYRFAGEFKAIQPPELLSQTKKIAVLPFENRSAEMENDYLSEGLSENLIDALSQIPQLKVIARSSSFKYKNQPHDAKKIAGELGVMYILDGRVARRGEKTVIRAELIDAEQETQIWGKTIECRICDLQEIKSDITKNVIRKLDLGLTREQENSIDKPSTFNDEAYQLYLKGLFLYRQGGIENAVKALEIYDQATALDPDFGFVHSLKPAIYSFLAEGYMDKTEAFEKAKISADEAMRTAEILPQTHVAAAIIKKWELDLLGALGEYRRALELNPNNTSIYNNRALILSAREENQQALADIERAMQLDPLLPYIKVNKGWILTNAKRFDEALELLRQTLKQNPELKLINSFVATAFEAKGQFREAISVSRELLGQPSLSIYAEADIIYNLYKLGEISEARKIRERLDSEGKQIPPTKLAPIYEIEGDRGAALELLEQAYRSRDPELHSLRVDFRLNSLHDEPRFRKLLRKIGLID